MFKNIENSDTIFANLGGGNGLFILDNDFAVPPYEWSINEVGPKIRYNPDYNWNGYEWIDSIERKHFNKIPYFMQKNREYFRHDDIWNFAYSFHKEINGGIVALFLDGYQSRMRKDYFMVIASTSSNYIQHFAKLSTKLSSNYRGTNGYFDVIAHGDAQTTEQSSAMWVHDLWCRIALREGSPKLEHYRTFLPRWVSRHVQN